MDVRGHRCAGETAIVDGPGKFIRSGIENRRRITRSRGFCRRHFLLATEIGLKDHAPRQKWGEDYGKKWAAKLPAAPRCPF
jgi:hypothetical protein